MQFYRFSVRRRGGLRVEVHLPGAPKLFRWTDTVGIGVGHWFLGAVRAAEYVPTPTPTPGATP